MSDGNKVLRPGSATYYLPERPIEKATTVETLPPEWIKQFDSTPSQVAKWLYDHEPGYARKVDLITEIKEQEQWQLLTNSCWKVKIVSRRSKLPQESVRQPTLPMT